MPTINPTTSLQQVAPRFNFEPLRQLLQQPLQEVLRENGLETYHASTRLLPLFLIWFVLAMVLRRDLNLNQVLDWMLSGWTWLKLDLVAALISEGALSHARVRLGETVFVQLFGKHAAQLEELPADFHGWLSVIFDGTTLDMPDTPANREAFGKPGGPAEAAFPQARALALLVPSARLLLDLAFGPCRGPQTGERSLLKQLFKEQARRKLLYLLDAGLYSLALAYGVQQRQDAFLCKISSQVGVKKLGRGRYRDGSYLGEIQGKVEGKRCRLVVRVIEFQCKGFRPCRLLTNLLEAEITAPELVAHYHQRWDIEIAFDEIKTHQCATPRGQAPTVLRSKRPDLVRQEIWALALSYNLVRQLMQQAAQAYDLAASELSFLDALQQVLNALPLLSGPRRGSQTRACAYLLYQLAHCALERPRRGRRNPRVVKRPRSKFRRKVSADKGELCDYQRDFTILLVQITEIGSATKPQKKAA